MAQCVPLIEPLLGFYMLMAAIPTVQAQRGARAQGPGQITGLLIKVSQCSWPGLSDRGAWISCGLRMVLRPGEAGVGEF